MDKSQFSLLLVAAVALASPLLWAAIGELISEIAGVLNIHLEGMMLTGAFMGVLGAHFSKSIVIGFLVAAIGGVLLALIHALVCFVFNANQIVSGVVLNLFAIGATSFGLSVAFKEGSRPQIDTLKPIDIPVLSDIPVVGQALFHQHILVYVGGLLVVGTWWFLRRTATGLRIQAAGEKAEAADSLGVNVVKTRTLALIACGVLAGIGGAQLSLAGVGTFTDNMTAGRGFIALAAVVFGRWKPVGTLVAVVIFAIADALAIRAQSLGVHIPNQLLLMLPYLVTLIALAGLVRRMRPPAQLGVNFERE
jgi:general nucleoside transport system permease protein